MTNKYTITETIAWEVYADTPQEALMAFMDATPTTQYGSYQWEITDRNVSGPDPKTGEIRTWEGELDIIEDDLAEEEETGGEG